MTIHIRQRNENDCTLAAIAMSINVPYETVWTPEDVEKVVKDQGTGDIEPWMTKASYTREDYHTVYIYAATETIVPLLWERRALISIASLNNENSNHMIYWDGKSVFDPQKGRKGKKWVSILRSCNISTVHLLK
jgi:hypothetical protein